MSAASKALEEVRQLVAADDRRDFEFAGRGFIATRKDPVIPRDTGDGAAFDLTDAKAGATVTMTRMELLLTLLAGFPVADFIEKGAIKVEGDAALYEALTGLIEAPKPNFNIVEP